MNDPNAFAKHELRVKIAGLQIELDELVACAARTADLEEAIRLNEARLLELDAVPPSRTATALPV